MLCCVDDCAVMEPQLEVEEVLIMKSDKRGTMNLGSTQRGTDFDPKSGTDQCDHSLYGTSTLESAKNPESFRP